MGTVSLCGAFGKITRVPMLHRGTQMEVGSVATDHLTTPQRRYLSILFCDLVGYTALSERLDPEELLVLQGQYQKLALTVMERYSGFVARFSGDGILVYFGYPTAHENDAERAVRAALELTEQMSKLTLEPADQNLSPLAVRVGIHTGLVVIGSEMASGGRQDHSIVGEPANLAARLQADAPSNSIVISSETLELIEGLFEFEHLGSKRFKGITRVIPVFKVNRPRIGARRNQGRARGTAQQMIGRTGPLELMQSRWTTVCDKARGDAMMVMGEAGVGKTRLVSEFVRQAKLADTNIVQINCHEIFASTPFYPVTGFVWAHAGIDADEEPVSATSKLATYLDLFGLGSEENIGIAASLLGFSNGADAAAPTPYLLKRKQVALLVALFEQLARSGPTLLWVEDAHWIDPSSAELIRDVITQLVGVPLFVVLTARSIPAVPMFPVIKPGNVIMLEQLDDRECVELARLLPGTDGLSEQELSRALDVADGIPLFIEQLVIAMVDQGGNNANGARRGNLPLTLAEMMSERLDRFPNERGIIQAAACIGRGFTPEFLAALLKTDAEKLDEPLHALTQAEMLRTRHDGQSIRYEFRHALLQRAAYDSMVQSERQAIHAGIVEQLTRTPEIVIPELLAHHLSGAGQHLNAVKAWLDAGVRAAQRSAHIEAIEHIRHGLDQLPKIPAEDVRRNLELNLRAALIGSLSAALGPTTTALSECCQRGLQLCNEGGPTPLVFPFLFGQITYVMCSGQTGAAQPLAELFLKLASGASYDSARVIGHRLVGMAMLGQGQAEKAREQLEASLALYDDKRDAAATHMFGQNFQVHSRSLLSLALFCTGDIERSLAVGFDALQFADSLRHPHSTALALGYVGGWVFGLCGAKRELMNEAHKLITLSDEHRLGPFRVFGTAFLGWAQCQQGNLVAGISTLQQATDRLENVQFKLSLVGHLANLADAMRRNGQLSQAQVVCARAIRLLNEGGERWLEPEVLRVEALVARDWQPQQQDKAIAMLENAVASARKLEFPIFELRCLTSLRDMLGPEQRDQAIEQRIEALSHLQNLDRRLADEMTRRMPEARA
ncbi:MAG: ATP-binding protein [Xanthobacteraceae bacterium]